MDWNFWIFLIIAFAVWIIGSLLRNMKGGQNQPGAPRGRHGPVGRQQEPAVDLDRFLREVHRRRQAAEQRETRERSARRPVMVEPVEEVPQARQESRRPIVTPVAEIPTVLPATPVLAAKPPPAMTVIPAALLAVPVEAVVPVIEVVSSPRPSLPGGLRELLESREGLRRAVILQEILGSPRCLRRR